MSGPVLRPVEFLTSTSASARSHWYNLDYRFAEAPQRVITCRQPVSTGTVFIEAAVSVDPTNVSVVAPSYVVTVTSFTTAFIYSFNEPWPYIRVRKTATSGGLNIIGVV
jgi:hypothetical protein